MYLYFTGGLFATSLYDLWVAHRLLWAYVRMQLSLKGVEYVRHVLDTDFMQIVLLMAKYRSVRFIGLRSRFVK